MAGTLLGWYRGCGVIPHTTDADMSLYSDQFESKIENYFLEDQVIPLSLKFGISNLRRYFPVSYITNINLLNMKEFNVFQILAKRF